jgi:iron complex transport system permease protein
LCVAATAFIFLLGLLTGASGISFAEGIAWLLGKPVGSHIHKIMLYVRLPRGLAALLCGACLAESGLLLQSALANPLASAGIIGVNSGAGLFAVLASVLFPGLFAARPALAFVGAVLAAFLAFGVSRAAAGQGGDSQSGVILAGVAVGSLLSAGTDAVTILYPDSMMDKTAFFIGGFAHTQMNMVLLAAIPAAIGFAAAGFLSARMNVLSLGDEVAASLGLHVGLCRGLAIFAAALLAASAVSVGGLLGFVGLIAPHAARFLFGYDHKRLVPLTALLGGGLTGLCDILARVLFAPYELPVGILLSCLGAPFFLLLIVRRRRLAL